MSAAVLEDRYPSRVGGAASIEPRRDPVLWGPADDGPLAPEQVDAYARDGFVVLPEYLDRATVDACRGAIADLEAAATEAGIAEPDDDASLRSLFRIERHPVFAALMARPMLAGVARQLLGSEVYLHQSRINLKRAFVGRGFPWHSDFETWHVEDGMPAMRAVSCSVALTDNGAHNGPLLLIAGSHLHFVACPGRTPADHHLESLRRQEYGVPDHASLGRLAAAGRTEVFTGPPGSVTFFECNTMHGSADNISAADRTNAFFVYNSVDNALTEPFGAPAPRPTRLAARRITPVSQLVAESDPSLEGPR